jgi:hypothetical protein
MTLVISSCSPTISIQTYPQYYVLSIKAASSDVLLQLTQLLAWMGSAIPPPDCSGQKSAYSIPIVENKTLGRHNPKLEFKISFRTAPLHSAENLSWLSLFKDSNIASGFPVPDRGDEVGLEMSYDNLQGMILPYQLIQWEKVTVLRTLTEMFVPIKKVDDRVQWHVIVRQDEKDDMGIEGGILRFGSCCMPQVFEGEVNFIPLSTRFFLY